LIIVHIKLFLLY